MPTSLVGQDRGFFDPVVETMNRRELRQLQEARLLQLIPYVYARSALVREVWDAAGVKPGHIRSMQDYFEKVPCIDKDTIRNFRDRHDDPYGGTLCARPPHLKGVGFTGGTTGDPTPIVRSTESPSQFGNKRAYWGMGVRAGDFVTYIQYTSRLGHHADRWGNSGYRLFPLQQRAADIPRLVEGSRLLKPKVLHMLSTPLIIALEQYSKTTGTDLREVFSSYKGAVFGGEPLGPRFRKLVESWGLEIFQLGTAEVASIMECKAHDGMHVWEDTCIIEHLKPGTNEPAEKGERGEPVVTALGDDVAPLMRFRLGDLTECSFDTCKCGRSHARIWPIGRIGDETMVRGRSVLPVDLMPIIQGIPETENGLFQIIRPQREVEILQLRVGYDEGQLANSIAALASLVADAVKARLDLPVEVELVSNTELLRNRPPHKIPRVTKS